MTKFASGKKSWAISDRSGLRGRYKDLVTEWNGSRVFEDEYEEKHPQLRRRRKLVDGVALDNPRPNNDQEVTLVSLNDNVGRIQVMAVGNVRVVIS